MLGVLTRQDDDGLVDVCCVEPTSNTGAHLASESVIVNNATVRTGSAKLGERSLGITGMVTMPSSAVLHPGSAMRDISTPYRMLMGANDGPLTINLPEIGLRSPTPLAVTHPTGAKTTNSGPNLTRWRA